MNLHNFTIEALREHTSKLQLAKILNVSTKTLYSYHDTALFIEDFEKDYPSFTKDSYPITKAALTKYQCWVIFSLMLICRRLPHEEVKECLREDKNPDFSRKFSKESFTNYGVETNEFERVCRISEFTTI